MKLNELLDTEKAKLDQIKQQEARYEMLQSLVDSVNAVGGSPDAFDLATPLGTIINTLAINGVRFTVGNVQATKPVVPMNKPTEEPKGAHPKNYEAGYGEMKAGWTETVERPQTNTDRAQKDIPSEMTDMEF